MSDVISLKDFREKKDVKSEESTSTEQVVDSTNSDEPKKPEEDFDFEAIMKANKEKADKMLKDRSKNNNGVKRSYNLRPDDPNNRRR